MSKIIGTVLIADKVTSNCVEIPKKELKNIVLKQQKLTRNFKDNDVIGKVNKSCIKDDELFIEAEIDEKYLGDDLDKYVFRPCFTYTPICSKCGKDWRECDHWFDEAHIIAKDIDVFNIGMILKKNDVYKDVG